MKKQRLICNLLNQRMGPYVILPYGSSWNCKKDTVAEGRCFTLQYFQTIDPSSGGMDSGTRDTSSIGASIRWASELKLLSYTTAAPRNGGIASLSRTSIWRIQQRSPQRGQPVVYSCGTGQRAALIAITNSHTLICRMEVREIIENIPFNNAAVVH